MHEKISAKNYQIQQPSQLVKKAMECVSTMDVIEWADQVFGPSALSKRREAFRLKNET